jgi:hypothetical protein
MKRRAISKGSKKIKLGGELRRALEDALNYEQGQSTSLRVTKLLRGEPHARGKKKRSSGPVNEQFHVME